MVTLLALQTLSVIAYNIHFIIAKNISQKFFIKNKMENRMQRWI